MLQTKLTSTVVVEFFARQRNVIDWATCLENSFVFFNFIASTVEFTFQFVDFLIEIRQVVFLLVLHLFVFRSFLEEKMRKTWKIFRKSRKIVQVQLTTSRACSSRRTTFLSFRSRSPLRLPPVGRWKNGLFWIGFVTISDNFFTASKRTELVSMKILLRFSYRFFLRFLVVSLFLQFGDLPFEIVMFWKKKTETRSLSRSFSKRTIDRLFEFRRHGFTIFNRLFKIVLTFLVSIAELKEEIRENSSVFLSISMWKTNGVDFRIEQR